MVGAELKNAAYDEAAQYALPAGWEGDRVISSGNTVDSYSTRDKDDAILLVNDGAKRHISVSIADTGTFLRDAPAVEAYARAMGETRYLHSGNVPMIPPRISEGILSILDDKRRGDQVASTPVIAVHLSLGQRSIHEIGPPELVREGIRPRSYTYGKVAALTAGEGNRDEVKRWRGYEIVAHRLLALRRDRGALAYYDVEKRIMTDEDGGLVEFRGKNMSGQLIVQEFMILANTAMAGYMSRHNIPALYRNHHLRPGADPERIAKLMAGGDITMDIIKSVYARARYSPQLEGHAGLNLRAYMHFTSPLRRFADFVNHANLAAHLDGLEYPYQGDELQKIADHLNSVQDETRRTKRESDVARIAAAGSVAVAAAVPKPSPPKKATKTARPQSMSFGKSLNAAIEAGELSADTADEARRRLAAGRLDTGEVAVLLSGRFANDEATVDLRADLLQLLAAQPAQAHRVVNYLSQTGVIGAITRKESPIPEGGFRSEITVTDDDGNVAVSQSATGANKNAASQGAAFLFVATLNGQPELAQGLSLMGSAENHKGILQEGLAKRGLQMPVYETTNSSKGFTCTITVNIGDKVHTFSGEGADKKLAEQAAAAAAREGVVLPTLPRPTPRPVSTPKPRPVKLTAAQKKEQAREATRSNPVVQLQNKTFEWHGNVFGTDNTEQTPKYEYLWVNSDPKAPEFECIVRVELGDGTVRPFSARGSSKANAKRAAAEAAMEFINSNEATDIDV